MLLYFISYAQNPKKSRRGVERRAGTGGVCVRYGMCGRGTLDGCVGRIGGTRMLLLYSTRRLDQRARATRGNYGERGERGEGAYTNVQGEDESGGCNRSVMIQWCAVFCAWCSGACV